MNKVLIDFPERLQANAFALFMEQRGFDLFQKYYGEKMENEPQPKSMEVEYDESEGAIKHVITVE